jgi:hypothetical protein
MGHNTLEIITRDRRTPALLLRSLPPRGPETPFRSGRFTCQRDALRVCASHGRTLSSAQTLRVQVSAFLTFIVSSFARTQARPNREIHADQALKTLATGELSHFKRVFAFSASDGGWDTPLGKAPPASEAVATRCSALPRSVDSFALSRAFGATSRSLAGVRSHDRLRPSSRFNKNAAPLPLAFRIASPALGLRFARPRSGRFALQRGQGSSVINHYCFWQWSGRHAHTALSLPPGSCTVRRSPAVADRLGAALRSNSTAQAARSAHKLPPSLAFTCFNHGSRVIAHPPINPNLSTTILLKPINGARNAPLDASLFNKISLLKAWRVSAPQPPRSYPLAHCARGVRRIAPERRGGPGASNSTKETR